MTTRTPASYFTVDEAAERMRVSPETIKRAVRSGALAAKLTSGNGGGKYILSGAALDTWYEALVDA